MSKPDDPREYEELEVIIRVVLGKNQPRKKRIVLEILPDGTTAVGKEISDRTKQPSGK